jgi:hypothetical protein
VAQAKPAASSQPWPSSTWAVAPVEAPRIDQHDEAGDTEGGARRSRAATDLRAPAIQESGTIQSMVV